MSLVTCTVSVNELVRKGVWSDYFIFAIVSDTLT